MIPTPPGTRSTWSAKAPLWIGMLSVVFLVGGLGVWGNFTTISGAIISSGMIQVESFRQVVQHPEGGVVGEITVQEGDRVDAGEVLIRFDDQQIRSQLFVVDGQLQEIRARQSRFKAERDNAAKVTFSAAQDNRSKSDTAVHDLIEGQQSLFAARLVSLEKQTQQLQERKAQIQLQIDGGAAQFRALELQSDLIRQELEDQQTLLNKGLAQASRVLSLQREAASLQGRAGELTAAMAQGGAQIVETEIQILQLQSKRREEAIANLRDLGYNEIELSEKLNSLTETLNRMEVRAPMSGIVHGLNVHAIRAVVRPAEAILYVVPTDSPLIINIRVEAIHVDQVNVGQDASLRFSTFDQRTTPEIFGKVTKKSADIFTDENTGISYYSAEILPNDGELDRLGDVELLPGMPVEAFIKTSERTPFSYLIKPLADYFNRAFREN